jgi:hypothetical protein
MLVVVAYNTYKMYALRYGIRLTTGKPRQKKSMKQLSREIRKYENTHVVRDGLYV